MTELALSDANSYAQWIRSVMTTKGTQKFALIGSSINEPVGLLKELLTNTSQDDFRDYYQSVFVNGNPYVVDFLSRYYKVSASQVLCTTGATTSLSLIYRTFTQPGDHVLIENPSLDVFRILAKERGLRMDFIDRPAAQGFALDMAQLEAKITKQTKLLVLSNLHNPSGALLTDPQISEIAKLAEKYNCLVVMDEVYMGYAEQAAVAKTAAQLAENIISINSLTKTHGLSSLRCGWIIAAQKWLEPLRRFSDLHEYGVSKLSHAVAGLVLREQALFADYRQEQMAALKPIMDTYMKYLVAENLINDFIPQFGCMYFPLLTEVRDTKHFATWLYKNYQVIVTPGEYFGLAGAIRVGVPENRMHLEVALEKLCAALKAYNGDRSSRRGGSYS